MEKAYPCLTTAAPKSTSPFPLSWTLSCAFAGAREERHAGLGSAAPSSSMKAELTFTCG